MSESRVQTAGRPWGPQILGGGLVPPRGGWEEYKEALLVVQVSGRIGTATVGYKTLPNLFPLSPVLVSQAVIAEHYRLNQQKLIFSQVWRLDVQNQGADKVRFSLRPLSLAWRWLPSCCVLTWPFL